MLDYETLDSIADSYIPVLVVLSLTSLSKTAILTHWRVLGIHAAIMSSSFLVAYGLMFIDSQLQLWSMMGLDYSTHTAVALAMVVFLIVAAKKYLFVWLGSLVCYVLLMLYQGYHSIEDILTTMLCVGLLLLTVVFLLLRSTRAQANKSLNQIGAKDAPPG